MQVLFLAVQLATGMYLTDGDNTGPVKDATVWHLNEEDGLQKLVIDTLRHKGFGILKVVPESDEDGYLRVAFFSEFKPVFFHTVGGDELVLSDEKGQLLEKRQGDLLAARYGELPVTYMNAVWRTKGFLYKEDEEAYKKELGI